MVVGWMTRWLAPALLGCGVMMGSAAVAAERLGPLPIDLLQKADPVAGKTVAERCTRCHSFEKDGPNRNGPPLYGILGAKRARNPEFPYSQAIKDLGGVWTPQEVQAFFGNPDAYMPTGKMGIFAGVKDPKDRADLLAYLNSVTDAPVDLLQGP